MASLGTSDGKESAPVQETWVRRPAGEGNDYPFQYSCLENSLTDEPSGLQSMGSHRVRHN